jgi:hypothetical protein
MTFVGEELSETRSGDEVDPVACVLILRSVEREMNAVDLKS